jgi:hypothetical protein
MEPNRGPSRVIGVRDDPTAQVAELYAVACPGLIGYLTVLTGSRADAEKIAEDTFVQALRHWSRIRQYDDSVAWLHLVATRLAISRGGRGQVADVDCAGLGRDWSTRSRTHRTPGSTWTPRSPACPSSTAPRSCCTTSRTSRSRVPGSSPARQRLAPSASCPSGETAQTNSPRFLLR